MTREQSKRTLDIGIFSTPFNTPSCHQPVLRNFGGIRKAYWLILNRTTQDVGQQVHVRQQFSKGRFSELKTRRSRRRVPLTDDLIAELKCWRLACPQGERDLVFPHISGGPLDHGILLRSGFYPALRRAKLRRIRFHDLRHTFASLLIAANVHPKRIQALMGHSTIRTTLDTYGHLMRDHDDHTAEKLAALISGNN